MARRPAPRRRDDRLVEPRTPDQVRRIAGWARLGRAGVALAALGHVVPMRTARAGPPCTGPSAFGSSGTRQPWPKAAATPVRSTPDGAPPDRPLPVHHGVELRRQA